MSNFYISIKEYVTENKTGNGKRTKKQVISLGDYVCSILLYVCAGCFWLETFILSSKTSFNPSDSSAGFMFILLILLGIGCLIWGRYLRKSQRQREVDFAQEIVEGSVTFSGKRIRHETVQKIICELEKAISAADNTAKWFVGILTTLLLFTAGIVGNIYSKIFDVQVSISTTQEKAEMAKDFVNSNSIESLLWAALWIFILLALPSVIAYISLGVYNFYKKRILSVLYETDYYFTQEEGEEDSVGEGK